MRCYLVDNSYENNIIVESPINQPEDIIEGSAKLSYTNLEVKPLDVPSTGHEFSVTAKISNSGSTGMEEIYLYVDGKVVSAKKLPFISNNERLIEFKYKFCDPGKHLVAIGKSSTKEVVVTGDQIYIIYRNLKSKVKEIPVGDSLEISSETLNMRAERFTQNVVLKIDGATGWSKGDNDGPAAQGTSIVSNENVNFSSTSEGIFITIIAGTNKIKLFALTGQLLLNGDLSQGRFFIPTRKGIYFLRINNKSFKVICK